MTTIAKKSTTSTSSTKKRKKARQKVCRFCESQVTYISYRDLDVLQKNLTERGRILPRRITGTCNHHQKMLAQAIKIARNLALVR